MTKQTESITSNIIDLGVLNRWNGELDRLEREELEVLQSYRGKKADIVSRRKRVFKLMKEAGVPVAELKIVRKQKKLADKIAELQEELEEDQRPVAEVISEALGAFVDLPLGQAAIAAVQNRHAEEAAHRPGKGGNAERVDSLTDDDGEDWDGHPDPEDEPVADNAA